MPESSDTYAGEEVDTAVWRSRVDVGHVAIDGMLPLTHCAACDKLYWQGGHALEMRARLASGSSGRFVWI